MFRKTEYLITSKWNFHIHPFYLYTLSICAHVCFCCFRLLSRRGYGQLTMRARYNTRSTVDIDHRPITHVLQLHPQIWNAYAMRNNQQQQQKNRQIVDSEPSESG